ncbi:MAG TPA: NnrU family protein [Candidatus Binataceae bacterium]|nr:NnrU family protein [Candidatus Binataceae bacterium]
MEAVIGILFWAVLFVGSHVLISASAVRPRLIGAVGEQPYRAIYSLVSLVTFVGLCVTFAHHKHAGAMMWDLRDVEAARWLTWLLMLLALVILAAGLMNPSPASMAARGRAGAPIGIQKLTRHPSFVAFTLFGIGHLLMNGWLGDICFFGAFPALGILGGLHQDARKLTELGASYRDYVAETSFIPGAALLARRQRWTAADTPWRAIVVGVALTAALVAAHPFLFGGHPLG